MAEKIKWKHPSLTTPLPSKAAKVAVANPQLMLISSSFLSIPVAESLSGLKGKEFILQISWCKPKIKPSCRNILTRQCFVWKQCEIPQHLSHLTASRGLSWVMFTLETAPRNNVLEVWQKNDLSPCGIFRAWSFWGAHIGASLMKSCFVLKSLY